MYGLRDLLQADPVTREAFRHDLDLDLIRATTHNKTLAYAIHLTEMLQHIKRKQTQGSIVDIFRPQCQGHNRHIVDRYRLDQGRLYIGRDLVHVGEDLVPYLDDGFAHILANVELYGYDRAATHRCGVSVLHTVYFL